MKILLERADTGWMVTCTEFAEKHSDLGRAACSALGLAEEHPDRELELGPGVPHDALDRGRRIRERLIRVPEAAQ